MKLFDRAVGLRDRLSDTVWMLDLHREMRQRTWVKLVTPLRLVGETVLDAL